MTKRNFFKSLADIAVTPTIITSLPKKDEEYSLPIAPAVIRGGVRIGKGLRICNNGTITINRQDSTTCAMLAVKSPWLDNRGKD